MTTISGLRSSISLLLILLMSLGGCASPNVAQCPKLPPPSQQLMQPPQDNPTGVERSKSILMDLQQKLSD